MFIFWGQRSYGAVEQSGAVHIVTRFFHVQFMPIFPIGSYLVHKEQQLERAIPLHGLSVLAAVLRTWGFLLMLVLVYQALDSGWGRGLTLQGLTHPALLFLAAALWSAVVFSLGRLSPAQKAQRQVYAEFVGAPVDVARLCDEGAHRDPELHQQLRAEVVERARGHCATSYREAADPQTEWDQIALSPTARDPRLLRAALTLARLEWALERGPRRARLAKSHDALWRKLQALQPAAAPPAL